MCANICLDLDGMVVLTGGVVATVLTAGAAAAAVAGLGLGIVTSTSAAGTTGAAVAGTAGAGAVVGAVTGAIAGGTAATAATGAAVGSCCSHFRQCRNSGIDDRISPRTCRVDHTRNASGRRTHLGHL